MPNVQPEKTTQALELVRSIFPEDKSPDAELEEILSRQPQPPSGEGVFGDLRSRPPRLTFSSLATREYVHPTLDKVAEKLSQEQAILDLARHSKIPFISRDCLPSLRLSSGLVLVGGMTGKAKTTTAVNIVCGFLRNSQKNVYLVNNEENIAAYLNKIACCMMGVSYSDYYDNLVDEYGLDRIRHVLSRIVGRIRFVASDAVNANYLEDTVSILEHVRDESWRYGMVVIDYHQTISMSRKNGMMESYQVSKNLGNYLREFSNQCPVPVVMLTQLKPKSESGEFQSRIMNDKTMSNNAPVHVEVESDMQNFTTTFRKHKDRNGKIPFEETVMRFNNGRYEKI